MNTFANFKALSSHYLLHSFGKRKHCVKSHFSICNERRIIKFGFLKSPAAFFRGNTVCEFQFLCKSWYKCKMILLMLDSYRTLQQISISAEQQNQNSDSAVRCGGGGGSAMLTLWIKYRNYISKFFSNLIYNISLNTTSANVTKKGICTWLAYILLKLHVIQYIAKIQSHTSEKKL